MNPYVVDPAQRDWRPCPGFPDYTISEDGIVMRIRKSVWAKPGLVMTQNIHQKGYRHVVLRKNGKSKPAMVHRLVAIAFLGPATKLYPEVNHKDGLKNNNHVSNLEWVTRSQNQRHAVKLGLKGGGHPRRVTEVEKAGIRQLRRYGLSYRAIARSFELFPSTILNICQGEIHA